MWLFSKRKGINDIARDDEAEDDICKDALPSFAPQISSERQIQADSDGEKIEKEPFVPVLEDENTLPQNTDSRENDLDDSPEEVLHQEECSDLEEDLPDPRDLYDHLKKLPLCGRYYALKDARLLMLHPDDHGNLYLFEEYGDYNIVSSGDCKAFVHIKGLRAYFKGKYYTTSDFEYIIKEKAWPLLVLAKNREQYNKALSEGYTPYKEGADKKGFILCKPISLYRMKELTVKAEIAFCSVVSDCDDYLIDVPYKLLSTIECDKDFKKFCKSLIDTVEKAEETPFFSLQVLKTAGNIAVGFPLEGNPRIGDFFAEGRITDIAPAKDGTLILMVGHDQQQRLSLKIGKAHLGQHVLSLEET